MRELTKYEAMNPSFGVEVIKEIAPNHAVIEIDPLMQGFGHTLGNALRRVLLTTIPGAAITSVRFSNANHQYTAVEGMSDSLLNIMLNLKQVVVASENDEEGVLRLEVTGPKTVTAADIEASAGFSVITPDQFITELVNNEKIEIEMKARTGTGFLTITDAQTEVVGEILLDSIFSPVINVSYKVEATRVGRQTDYDKLIMDIKTNGSLTPLEAVDQAARILARHFTQVFEPVMVEKSADQRILDPQEAKIMLLTVEELDLPTRISNALRRGGFKTVADLLNTPKAQIARVKNLGDKSVEIVAEVLAAKGIHLMEE